MSKKDKIKEKNRQVRRQQEELRKKRDEELLDDSDQELTEEEERELLQSEHDSSNEIKPVEKYYDESGIMMYGPTNFADLDNMREMQGKARQVERASWDVETLVHNILMSSEHDSAAKADMIKKVGTEFGERVGLIINKPAEKVSKESPEVLEIEAILAHDERHKSLLEKALSVFQKKDLSYGERENLEDGFFALVSEKEGKKVRKYPIHDKAHVRNALARAAQQIKAGGEGADDARKALPKIRAAAKRMGIEMSMEKDHTGIIVQKDGNGDWRWIGWPSNNFIDRSEDILTQKAHEEYVEWWHKNKPNFPVFTSLHAPKTARTHPVDFVGYQNGFLIMSGKLTETEAVALLEVQKEYDLGMSHTGWGVRDSGDPRQIAMYRIFEVTDLPIEMADNPFTDLSVVSKEADMKHEEQLAYLTKLMGSEDRAKEALESKTSLKQKELQDAGVEQKETAPQPEEKQVAEPVALDMQAILEAVSKELDVEGLNTFVQTAQEALDKVGLLEGVIQTQQETIQKLTGDKNEQLAEMLTPPAAGRFAWSKEARASQSKETQVDGEELEKAKSKQAGIPDDDEYWLSKLTGTVPVQAEAES